MAPNYARRARLQVERLEDRQLLAGGITLNATLGIVNVQGTPRNDTVTVAPAHGGMIQVTLKGGGHARARFTRNQVHEVVVQGNGGHDRVVNHAHVPALQVDGPASLVAMGATNAARTRRGHGRKHAGTNAGRRLGKRAASPSVPAVGANGLSGDEQLILQQTNAARAARGLPPLVINPLLQAAAEARARAEANGNTYFADGGFPGDITGTGYAGSIMGQNDAYNYGYPNAAQQLMNQWLGSPPHYANIVDHDYVEVGIAVATNGQGNTFGVQTFGAP
jgi:uncharacterized protein YkwD